MITLNIFTRAVKLTMVFIAVVLVFTVASPGMTKDVSGNLTKQPIIKIEPGFKMIEALQPDMNPLVNVYVRFQNLGVVTADDHSWNYAYTEVQDNKAHDLDRYVYIYVPNAKIYNVLLAAYSANRYCWVWVREIPTPDEWPFNNKTPYQIVHAETGGQIQ